jgi:hypothetical protein
LRVPRPAFTTRNTAHRDFNAQRETRNAQPASILLLALILAIPAGGIALGRGFDGLYGQDAYAYFDYATTSVRNSILHLQPLEGFFWPPGYPLLVAVVSSGVGAVPLSGQVVSLAMGALVPVFTTLLVRELWPADFAKAILAGLLVALCGQLWQSSVVVMADSTGLALATLATWALVRYSNPQRHLAWLLVASVALAYATLARWIYGLVAIPFAAYALWALPRRNPSRAIWHTTGAVVLGGALLLPLLGPPLVGLLSHPAEPAAFAGNLQVYSWSPLNALRRDFFTADGHLSYVLPNGVYYAIAPGNLAYFGPLLAPWAALGLWVSAREWRRPALLLIVGWLAIVYAFHAGAPWQNFRFTLAYLPPLAILVSAGLLWAWRTYTGNRGIRLLVATCAAAGLLVMAGGGVRLMRGFIDRKDDELALVRWVADQTPPGARLLSFGPTLAFRHYSQLPTLDLFDTAPDELPSLVGSGERVYVLVDEASIEQQWSTSAPGQNLLALRARPGLEPVGTFGSYTLFHVGSA